MIKREEARVLLPASAVTRAFCLMYRRKILFKRDFFSQGSLIYLTPNNNIYVCIYIYKKVLIIINTDVSISAWIALWNKKKKNGPKLFQYWELHDGVTYCRQVLSLIFKLAWKKSDHKTWMHFGLTPATYIQNSATAVLMSSESTSVNLTIFLLLNKY